MQVTVLDSVNPVLVQWKLESAGILPAVTFYKSK